MLLDAYKQIFDGVCIDKDNRLVVDNNKLHMQDNLLGLKCLSLDTITSDKNVKLDCLIKDKVIGIELYKINLRLTNLGAKSVKICLLVKVKDKLWILDKSSLRDHICNLSKTDLELLLKNLKGLSLIVFRNLVLWLGFDFHRGINDIYYVVVKSKFIKLKIKDKEISLLSLNSLLNAKNGDSVVLFSVDTIRKYYIDNNMKLNLLSINIDDLSAEEIDCNYTVDKGVLIKSILREVDSDYIETDRGKDLVYIHSVN